MVTSIDGRWDTNIFFYIFDFFTLLFSSSLIKDNLDLSIAAITAISRVRDSKGRFKAGYTQIYEPLPSELLEALYGELLGDGHLRFHTKGEDGKGKTNTNVQFEITLKSKEHITHLWENTYGEICSKLGPRQWPGPNSGKVATQYHLASKSLPSITVLHEEWYTWSVDNKKYVKIVPLNICELLTARGLALTPCLIDGRRLLRCQYKNSNYLHR